MAWSVASLLHEERRGRAQAAAGIGAIALAGFWIVDALCDSLLLGERALLDELIRPTWPEIWMRLLVGALIVLLYLDRRARAKLRLLSFVLDEAPDGVQITDLDGRVAYSNRAVTDLYGFSPAELRGKRVTEMNVDAGQAASVILPTLRRQGRWAGEIEVKHKDGRTSPVWLTTSLIVDPRGSPLAAVGILRDVSERRRADEELRRYARRLEEATRLKDLFADILRHDLIGPAAALRVSIDSLSRRDLDAGVKRTLAQARRSCTRLTEMVESAARYAKLSTVEQIDFETLDLRAVLRTVIADFDPLLAERATRVVLEGGEACLARANPIIADVFANLLSNAIKYGPPGGTISVDVRDAGERWIASVADRGEGIADQDKQRIFTRFERIGKEGVKGSGLGLAIARRVVDLHRGRIWVEDNPLGGSVFRVELPKR